MATPRARTAPLTRSLTVPFAAALAVSGCAAARGGGRPASPPAWQDRSAAAVSRPVVGAGVVAVTALGVGGRPQTLVLDLSDGRRRWTRTATTADRPVPLGVAPPAIGGAAGRPVVADIEPLDARATLAVRDARTGALRWSRPVHATFGPAACGEAICVSESTARESAAFTVLDAATGRVRWRVPGVAEVEWADAYRVVIFRPAAHPMVEAHEPTTGRLLWRFSVERALGPGADTSGGWVFGALDDRLVGYVGPYQARPDGRPTAFGFFSLRLDDGGRQWTRRGLLRVYPGANPAVALIAREVDANGRGGGFVQLDPRTGGPVARVPAAVPPPTGDWRPAFPADLSALGLIAPGRAGRAYDLRTGRPLAGHVTAWSRCAPAPSPLVIDGRGGFVPATALCPYDVRSGRPTAVAGAPPGWYTGATDGWRVWRDERGGLHARRDAGGTVPGMDG